jgi:ubiquinone/menaquinone biosynthesis C-methylase UbiE
MNRHSQRSEQTAEQVQEHFQGAASEFDDLYRSEEGENRPLQRLLRPGLFYRAEAAVELASEFEAPRILDIGCGSARVGEQLLDASGGTYVGVDFSGPMLELAEQRMSRFGPKAKLVTGDFLEAELEGNFDLIVALGLFDYLDRPELFTRRMFELCSEKGAAIASFPRWTAVKGPIRKVRYEWINKCPIFNYTRDGLEDLFSESGFERRQIEQKYAGFMVRAWRSA